MTLIAGDNRRDRQRRSIEAAPPERPKTKPRVSKAKAAKNVGKHWLRMAKILRCAKSSTIRERKGKCDECDLLYRTADGRKYCGEPYATVTVKGVEFTPPDKLGCGCRLERKWNDPAERCPKEPPEWVEEA